MAITADIKYSLPPYVYVQSCTEEWETRTEKIEYVQESRPQESTGRLEAQFLELVEKWKSQTGGYSTTTRRYAHPSYQSILALKGDIVPLILNELRERPDWWFEALKVLTKQNPTKPQSTFEEAVTAWLDWGKQNHKIS